MKKWLKTLMLLTAALLLALAPALAETDDGTEGPVLPTEGWVADSIDGTLWKSEGYSLEVIPEGDGFKVLIIFANSEWEISEWTYGCHYDAETQTLTAGHLICDDVSFGEGEEEDEVRTNVIDVDCETTFSLNAEGQLVILNAADQTLEGRVFTPVVYSDSEPAVG